MDATKTETKNVVEQTKQQVEQERVWYFAYGANMNPSVLQGRRGVKPKESKPCIVPDMYLNFDYAGIPYWEPGFATVSRRDPRSPSEPAVHGVVHYISAREFARIRRTEGGFGYDGLGYGVEKVQAHCYDGSLLDVFTLVATPSVAKENLCPSVRYMDLLLAGARHENIRDNYIKHLESFPAYRTQGVRAVIGKWLFLPLVALMLTPFFVCILFKKRPPRWLTASSMTVNRYLWKLHDYVWAPIFGRGT